MSQILVQTLANELSVKKMIPVKILTGLWLKQGYYGSSVLSLNEVGISIEFTLQKKEKTLYSFYMCKCKPVVNQMVNCQM